MKSEEEGKKDFTCDKTDCKYYTELLTWTNGISWIKTPYTPKWQNDIIHQVPCLRCIYFLKRDYYEPK